MVDTSLFIQCGHRFGTRPFSAACVKFFDRDCCIRRSQGMHRHITALISLHDYRLLWASLTTPAKGVSGYNPAG